MKLEIQKDDVILPGGIGTVRVGDKEVEIIQKFESKDGSVTWTCVYIEGFVMDKKSFPAFPEPKQLPPEK